MAKTVLLILLLAQPLAVTGPVCGNHATTMESMSCCEKGHHKGGSTFSDEHASDCCATCDMGKSSGVNRAQVAAPQINDATVAILPATQITPIQQAGDSAPFSSYSPPSIFLLDRSFRI